MTFRDYDWLPPPPVNDDYRGRPIMDPVSVKRLCAAGITFWIAVILLAQCAFGAERNCGPAAEVADNLKQRYGEILLWSGVGEVGAEARLFVSPKTGTWSWVAIAGETACLIASGSKAELGEQMPGDPT